jgi:hypothetical protein
VYDLWSAPLFCLIRPIIKIDNTVVSIRFTNPKIINKEMVERRKYLKTKLKNYPATKANFSKQFTATYDVTRQTLSFSFDLEQYDYEEGLPLEPPPKPMEWVDKSAEILELLKIHMKEFNQSNEEPSETQT